MRGIYNNLGNAILRRSSGGTSPSQGLSAGLLVVLALLFAALHGCEMRTESLPKSTLPVIELRIGGHRINAEVAETPEVQQTGLMYRREMPQDQGMLFLLGNPRQASFWMKNTYLPLSIAYIDPEGVILEIHPLEPHNTSPVASKAKNVAFALETNRGWFDEKGIKPGDKIEGLPR